MTRFVSLLTLLALVLALACCGGYTPPPQTDRTTSAYRTDLAACEDSVPAEVNKRNAKTGLAWFSSPVRRPFQIGDGVRGCMAAKGYGRLRWCTDDEIRQGDRSGAVVATASGLQCADRPQGAAATSR